MTAAAQAIPIVGNYRTGLCGTSRLSVGCLFKLPFPKYLFKIPSFGENLNTVWVGDSPLRLFPVIKGTSTQAQNLLTFQKSHSESN